MIKRRSIAGFWIALFTVTTLLIILLLTPIGLRIGLHFVSAILPGHMTYEHASGVINGPIEIHNFKYTDEKSSLSIRKLKFSWNLWPLLHRKISFSHFQASHVHLTLQLAQPPQSIKKEEKAPEQIKATAKKPFLLIVKHAQVTHLSIGFEPKQYPIFIRHIVLNAHIIPGQLNIRAQAQMLKPLRVKTFFNVNGNFDRYTLYVRAVSEKFFWHLYGIGNSNRLSLSLNEGATLGGKLSFNADVSWAPEWQWDITLNGTHLNFKKIDAHWPSQITTTLSTQGSIENNNPKFTLNTFITAPGVHIDLATEQKNKLNLKWDVNISNLSNVYKKFSGSLQSTGEWTPETNIPAIKGEIHAHHFSALNYKGDTLDGKWVLHPNQQQPSSFNISGTNLSGPDFQFSKAELQGKGSTHAHQLQGSIGIANNHFAFQMQGGLFEKIWKGQLQKLTLVPDDAPQWKLARPIPILLSTTKIMINNLCLNSTGQRNGSLCLNGFWDSSAAWQFRINSQHFNLSTISDFILHHTVLNAPASLQTVVRGQGTTLQTVNANIAWSKGSFRYPLDNYGDIVSPLQQGNLKVSLTKNNLNAISQLVLSKNNKINFSASIPNFSEKISKDKLRINGKLQALFSDLSPFSTAFKAVVQPRGKLSMDLSITGLLSAPNVQGKISLYDGSVYSPRLGINLTKIDINLLSLNHHQINYKATAYSKNQPIQIMGSATLTPEGLKSASTIQANNALIMDTGEYTIYASPKLSITTDGYDLNLTGSVTIPEGIIQPPEFTTATSLPTDQVVYTAGEPSTLKSIWQISADVNVVLGNNVRVKTSGFDTLVTGAATIIGKPKTTTLANGRINVIKGVYSAYGKTLTISPGSYIEFMNTPVDNPNFDIRATKLIQITQAESVQRIGLNNITVGIELRGSFRHPAISLFSIPATLSQADILSYLVLGYSSQTPSGSNLGLLLDAANSLSGKGTGIGGAISEIKQQLGLEELGVESETVLNAIDIPVGQQTAFVIGKRLTKNIYVRYSLGLGQGPLAPANIFELRYTFNPHWSIQTNSSSLGNGGDILYTIETN